MTRKQHKNLIKHLKWLDKFVFQILSNVKQVDIKKPQEVLLCFQIAKMHTTYSAIIELINKGYGIDAMILMRSLLNNLINSCWINIKYSKTRAHRFIDYNVVLMKKTLGVAKKYPEHETIFRRILSKETEINSSYKRIKSKFKNKNEWSGKSIYERAKETDLIWDYDFIYNLSSSLEHSDVHSLKDFVDGIDINQKLINFRGGPSKSYINESAITAVKYMGQGLELFLKVFKLEDKYQRRLNSFGKRFAEFMKNNVSGSER